MREIDIKRNKIYRQCQEDPYKFLPLCQRPYIECGQQLFYEGTIPVRRKTRRLLHEYLSQSCGNDHQPAHTPKQTLIIILPADKQSSQHRSGNGAENRLSSQCRSQSAAVLRRHGIVDPGVKA